MQPATAYVVIAHEAEHLGFPRVAVIGRHVQYLVDVAHEGGAVQPRRHIAAGVAAKSLRLACAIGVGAAFGAILLVALDEFFAEIAVCHGCFFRLAVRDGLVFGSRKFNTLLNRFGKEKGAVIGLVNAHLQDIYSCGRVSGGSMHLMLAKKLRQVLNWLDPHLRWHPVIGAWLFGRIVSDAGDSWC